MLTGRPVDHFCVTIQSDSSQTDTLSMYTVSELPSLLTEKRKGLQGHRPRVIQFSIFSHSTSPDFDSEPSQGRSSPISDLFQLPPTGDAPSYKEISSTAQSTQALGKVMYISLCHSHCIRSGGDPAPAGQPPFHRSAQPSADGPHDGQQCAVPQHPRRRHTSHRPNPRHSHGCGATEQHRRLRLLLSWSHCHPWA